ncbi:hypothetical protein Tco_1056265 [Tanacetum coccineum]|uniref:Uncharacterized protein n=1 Tax=Tanacetum coccineum TaxID=301880 RepID=A0ABQ5H4D8_9ASTR
MCCNDVYRITPHDSALAGCDKLVSEPEDLEDEPIEEEHLEEPKVEGLLEESENEADSHLLSDARSRPGPAELGDSCERKFKPK